MRPRFVLSAVSLSALLALSACGDAADRAETAMSDTAEAIAETPAASPGGSEFLDPNSASLEQLTAVPGMTPEAADALIEGRPYDDMRGVDAAIGSLPEAARDSIYTEVWKPLDLNSASDEEILLIPGVGDRMLHEFEEYRPYTSMDQFNREIGKYVDDEELARLASYVTIR
ncbi:MAG: hypothetical protein ACREL6_01805 [Gemmatimonadales bacterium]